MVNLRPKAEVDLLEIWDFIFQGSDLERADAFVDRILATCNMLESTSPQGYAVSQKATTSFFINRRLTVLTSCAFYMEPET
jgi:plasmid stabilization system protein ParE